MVAPWTPYLATSLSVTSAICFCLSAFVTPYVYARQSDAHWPEKTIQALVDHLRISRTLPPTVKSISEFVRNDGEVSNPFESWVSIASQRTNIPAPVFKKLFALFSLAGTLVYHGNNFAMIDEILSECNATAT
jgi:hypothetical protein